MKNKVAIFTSLLVLLLATLACNLPGDEEVPTAEESTPNATMTALFNIITLPPTAEPVLATATIAEPYPTATTVLLQPTQTASQMPPTSTAASTNTPAPLPTITNTPELRSAGRVQAEFLTKALTLDGVWDEWDTDGFPAKYVVFGKDEWDGEEDLEGSYRVAWDANYLYIAAKVIDNRYVQNATGIDIFKGDSIELLLDVDLMGDLSSKQLTSDDYQVVVSPGKGKIDGPKEAYLYYPANVAGPRTQVKIASQGVPGIYRVEIAFPWSLFGITPKAGQKFGFAFSVSDNDNVNLNLQQTMVSSVYARALTDPTTWAVLTLLP